MIRRVLSTSVVATALLVAPAMCVAQQAAVTVSGHVSANGGPVSGAHVRVDGLPIDRITDSDGRFSFVVPSANVHGQSVRVTASMSDRNVRYVPQTKVIRLVGGEITLDFELFLIGDKRAPQQVVDSVRAAASAANPPVSWDTLGLADEAGAVDLPRALAGRYAGLSVTSSSTLGGSSSLVSRGPRSLLGSSQPLFVVNGVVRDNTVYTSPAQRFGAGGFDFGSPVQDINLNDIRSLNFLSGPEAAALFGGRASNGVVLVTTRDGMESRGFGVSASEQITSLGVPRLPAFQNQYGQGLDGKFDFLNGRGGGINDGVDQSWGPALDGSPRTQASYKDPGQPDVRFWSAHPDNVLHYFSASRSSAFNAAAQAHSDLGSFRVGFRNVRTYGLTPNSALNQRDGSLHLSALPTTRLTLALDASAAETRNTQAPGTGYNEGNPVSQFTRMGRQVDTDSLRVHLRDSANKQISWNYAGQNNPYFAALENTNHRERNHAAVGGSLVYAVTPWLNATARTGTEHYRDDRLFSIASGWMGGFPFYAAPGDFSKGGSEGNDIAVQQTTAVFRLDAVRTISNGVRWTLGGGADLVNARRRILTGGVDSAVDVPAAGAPDTAKLPSSLSWSSHSRTDAVFGETGFAFRAGTVRFSLRDETAAIVPGQHVSTLYPSLSGSVDLGRLRNADQKTPASTGASLRAGWWKSGGDMTSYAVETMYAGRSLTGAIAPAGDGLLVADSSLSPEITTAWQLGTDLWFLSRRLTVGVTYYNESTSGVILPVPSATLNTVVAMNAGELSNHGLEAQATIRLGDGSTGLGWDISANASKNTNTVEHLFGMTTALPLGPPLWGLSVEARQGLPLGVLMGTALLRDPSTHALLLRGGLPLPDSVAGPQQLGIGQPDWVVGFQNTLRYRWFSLTTVLDGHIGGSIFSATNYWGDFAGTLAETSFRPDSGLLIAGLDAATGKANTQHVSTQDYYHALSRVQAPWVYSATYVKLRELRLSATMPNGMLASLPFQTVTASVVARNLHLWANAPNIDPETILSPYQLMGVELGQLPTARTIGVQVSITP